MRKNGLNMQKNSFFDFSVRKKILYEKQKISRYRSQKDEQIHFLKFEIGC